MIIRMWLFMFLLVKVGGVSAANVVNMKQGLEGTQASGDPKKADAPSTQFRAVVHDGSLEVNNDVNMPPSKNGQKKKRIMRREPKDATLALHASDRGPELGESDDNFEESSSLLTETEGLEEKKAVQNQTHGLEKELLAQDQVEKTVQRSRERMATQSAETVKQREKLVQADECKGNYLSWNSGYGDCSSYAPTAGNGYYKYCNEDTNNDGLSAEEVCPQCGQCEACPWRWEFFFSSETSRNLCCAGNTLQHGGDPQQPLQNCAGTQAGDDSSLRWKTSVCNPNPSKPVNFPWNMYYGVLINDCEGQAPASEPACPTNPDTTWQSFYYPEGYAWLCCNQDSGTSEPQVSGNTLRACSDNSGYQSSVCNPESSGTVNFPQNMWHAAAIHACQSYTTMLTSDGQNGYCESKRPDGQKRKYPARCTKRDDVGSRSQCESKCNEYDWCVAYSYSSSGHVDWNPTWTWNNECALMVDTRKPSWTTQTNGNIATCPWGTFASGDPADPASVDASDYAWGFSCVVKQENCATFDYETCGGASYCTWTGSKCQAR